MFPSLRAVIIVSVVTLLVPSARAENKEKARELYRAATHNYDFGEYQQALDGFKEAYQNYEDPAFLFNIAQCHRAIGHKQEAITFYKSYLRNSSDAPNRDEVQKTIADLQAAIDREKLTAQPVAPSVPPAPVAQTTTPTVPAATVTTKADKRTPSLKWVWGVVAATVGVVALGVGLGVGLSSGPNAPSANTSAGTFRF